MNKLALLFTSLAAMLVALLLASPIQAANNMTFVSSGGTDAGACTKAAPCATLNFAVAQTNPEGEVRCLDFGPYNSFSVGSQSITIDCEGGSVVAPASTILFGPAANKVVIVRNMIFNGLGTGGSIDVQGVSGTGTLIVENCKITGFRGGQGFGIKIQPPVGQTTQVYVSDSVISNNGVPASGAGIGIQPFSSGSVRVVLNRVQVENNTHGILADGTNGTGSIVVQVRDSVVTGNTGNGIAAITQAGASPTGIVVDRTSSVGNAGSGILAQGAGALVHIGNSTVVGNGAGLNAASGGNIFSYQNNQTKGNSFDGAPTGVLTLN